MTAPHLARKPPKRRPKPKATLRQYPEGFFVELIRAHSWPPNFKAQMEFGPKHNIPPRGQGFDRVPLGLPGAAIYTGNPLKVKR